jgi:hypothetical protein
MPEKKHQHARKACQAPAVNLRKRFICRSVFAVCKLNARTIVLSKKFVEENFIFITK